MTTKDVGLSYIGSSPHTRGLLNRGLAGRGEDGIIPAHAGFTAQCYHSRFRIRDHPRTRGVYREHQCLTAPTSGSSPHTRGLRQEHTHQDQGLGIIPAHAGFTSGSRPSARAPEDHPRTRGVYDATSSESQNSGGSSPHTRGLPTGTLLGLVRTRIIPAHAGFTPGRPGGPGTPRDHPRTRGVYALALPDEDAETGSSPHTRGLRHGGGVSGGGV